MINFRGTYVCSIGSCQRYLGRSNLCNSLYKSSEYIFIATNQSFVSNELDSRVLPVLQGYSEMCSDLISRMLCHYFFAPCGANGLLHLPLSVCSKECHYVESTCTKEWIVVTNLLSVAGLGIINCSTTDALLQGLAPCCIDAGIDSKCMFCILGT